MKDGFFLSTYLNIDEIGNLTGYVYRHDQNIALWKKQGKKIELVRYWELERITGLKQHDNSIFSDEYAINIINQLLAGESLSINDIVDIWGTPRLGTSEYFDKCKYSEQYAYHSLCHLFSSLLSNTKKIKDKTVIGLALDGGPDIVTQDDAYTKKYFCGCVYQRGNLELFPISSPGCLWISASNLFNMREGTLMALATASKSEYMYDDYEEIVLMESGCQIKSKAYVNKLYNEIANITNDDIGKNFTGYDPNFTEQENKISMVMKQIQKVSTKMVVDTIENVVNKYHIDTTDAYVALAGGFALNCPTNKAVMERFNFIDLIAPPCVNDGGLALGCGLLSFYQEDKEIEFVLDSPFYGEDDESLDIMIEKYSSYIEEFHVMKLQEAVEDIIREPVIWFDGKAEIGPRALGHRSILADPRKLESKEQLNNIKQREWWRPVAPIVLEECGNDIFEKYANSEYMLRTFKIRKEIVPRIPAVAHLNETARIQSLNEKQNAVLYQIIKEFYKRTGIPLICNTSLNDKGEPIINKIEEAINFALRKGINVAYINNYRVKFYNHDLYTEDKPLARDVSNVFPFSKDELFEVKKQINPYNLKCEDLQFFYWNFNVFKNFDLHMEKDVKRFLRLKKVMS